MPTRMHLLLLVALPLVALPWALAGDAPADAPLTRPVALAFTDGGARLLVANRDGGTMAVIDTRTLKVVGTTRVGKRLSDLTVADGQVFVTDEAAGELIVLERRGDGLAERRRIKVGVSPVTVRVRGGVATVACLWPRRLVVVDWARGDAKASAIDLPFAPRRQLFVPGTAKVIVADAFAGGLAVADVERRRVDSVRHLPAHNLRGLSLDRRGTGVLLAHQVLHPHGHSNPGDIRSGTLIANQLHRLALASLLDPVADVLRDDRRSFVGDVERGAGDPADVVEADDGTVLVAVAGTGELHVGWPDEARWERLDVGSGAAAVTFDPARRRAYVACTFDDSVAVVDVAGLKRVGSVRLGPGRAPTAAERGEALFHDARLSFEAWFSCQSCHPGGHTSGRLNDNLTDGSLGTPKRVPSLLGTRDTGPWAWNGTMATLEAQLRTSIKGTMHAETAPTAGQVADLAAYLRTLPPPPSVAAARGTPDAEAVRRGGRVFRREKCVACHTPPVYTSAKTYDVGLRDEAGGTHFNPPSLRGVSQGGPYFHDGRAATLRDVLTRVRHQLPGELPEADVTDLLQFLQSL